LNNHSFNRLNAELREGDPLCRYVTLERSSIELTLAQYAENAAQLAIACELLQRTRTELQRAWHDSGKQLQPYQEAAVHSIDECLSVSRAAIRRYRHSVRHEYAASLRELLARTVNALPEHARHEAGARGHKDRRNHRDHGRKPAHGGGLPKSLLLQFLTRKCIASEAKGHRSRRGL